MVIRQLFALLMLVTGMLSGLMFGIVTARFKPIH